MKKVIIINGPNLNLLGERQTDIYGNISLEQLNKILKDKGNELKLQVDSFQSNFEGKIINSIHNARNKYDYIILNGGAYSHYSIAIRDAIESINIPVIELHISNIYAREEFRSQSIISSVCKGVISGFGIEGYLMALYYINQG